MYHIYYYVPEAYLEQTKAALFTQGAGQIGDYQHCAWQVAGQGQFRPMPGNNAFIGKTGELSKVSEYRVEMVCSENCLPAAVKALCAAHPYEEPAYGFWKIETL